MPYLFVTGRTGPVCLFLSALSNGVLFAFTHFGVALKLITLGTTSEACVALYCELSVETVRH